MDIAIIFVTPVALVLMGLLIVRRRRLEWRGDVGVRLPDLRAAALWVAAFVVLAIFSELASRRLGIESAAGAWRGKYDTSNLLIRIVAIAVIYPIAEEFFFRGAFLGMVTKRFNAAAGILASSALFALIHVQYDWRGMLLILADALFFALCRTRSGSLYLTMLLHMLGNSYAVWERIAG